MPPFFQKKRTFNLGDAALVSTGQQSACRICNMPCRINVRKIPNVFQIVNRHRMQGTMFGRLLSTAHGGVRSKLLNAIALVSLTWYFEISEMEDLLTAFRLCTFCLLTCLLVLSMSNLTAPRRVPEYWHPFGKTKHPRTLRNGMFWTIWNQRSSIRGYRKCRSSQNRFR